MSLDHPRPNATDPCRVVVRVTGQALDERSEVGRQVLFLVEFGIACGNTLARAHARSGDPVAIDAYMGKSDVFTKAMRKFARRYADQTERDHAALVPAIRRGKAEGIRD